MAGGYAHDPQGLQKVAAEIRALKEENKRIRAMISGLGITIDPATNSLVVSSGRTIRAAAFDGTTDPPAVGTQGWALTDTDTIISNNLLLGGQLIGNDALASPVFPARAHGQGNGFGLTTTQTSYASVSVSVPAGYSRALCMASMSGTAVNTTAAQDFFGGYADVNAAGSPGGWIAAADGAPGYAVGLAHTETALITGLGASIQFRAMLQSGAATWPANAFNTVNIDALVLFLR